MLLREQANALLARLGVRPMINSTQNGDQAQAPQLDPRVVDTIGSALKAHYDDLVHAPLPPKFLDLLAQLGKEEQRENPDEKP